jgi:hypothetical protein
MKRDKTIAVLRIVLIISVPLTSFFAGRYLTLYDEARASGPVRAYVITLGSKSCYIHCSSSYGKQIDSIKVSIGTTQSPHPVQTYGYSWLNKDGKKSQDFVDKEGERLFFDFQHVDYGPFLTLSLDLDEKQKIPAVNIDASTGKVSHDVTVYTLAESDLSKALVNAAKIQRTGYFFVTAAALSLLALFGLLWFVVKGGQKNVKNSVERSTFSKS